MTNPTLSVIIVSYNNQDTIKDCLDALPWSEISMQVIIIDNASSDQTRDRIHDHIAVGQRPLTPIWNTTNRGYAAAVNQGLARVETEFILLLGPDAFLRTGAVTILMNVLTEHANAAISAPRLIDPDGILQPSCRRFPTRRDLLLELTGLPRRFPHNFKPVWKMSDFNHGHSRQVDQPEASCWMIRGRAADQIGPLDEQFPIFFNDVDWCRRLYRAGWKVIFQPEATVVHVRGASVRQFPLSMIWKSHQGFYRYFKKYSETSIQKWINLLFGFLLIAAALLRAGIVMLPTGCRSNEPRPF